MPKTICPTCKSEMKILKHSTSCACGMKLKKAKMTYAS